MVASYIQLAHQKMKNLVVTRMVSVVSASKKTVTISLIGSYVIVARLANILAGSD